MTDNRKLIDPDPVAIALTIYGAIGTLATIADAVQTRVYRSNDQRDKQAEYSKELLRLAVDLEAAVNNLQADYETIKDIFYSNLGLLPNQEQIDAGSLGDEFVLGQFKLVLKPRDFQSFARAHQQIAKQSLDVIRDTYSLVAAIRNHEVGLDTETFEKLVDLRAKINRLVGNRLTYEDGLQLISELIHFSSDVCRDIKQNFLPGPRSTPQRRRMGGGAP